MKLIRQYINEKFTEDSDPIQDLGIGIVEFWKKEREIMRIRSSRKSSKIYFDTEIYSDEALIIYIVLDFLCKQIERREKINPQKAYLETIDVIKRWQFHNLAKQDLDFDKVIYALKKFLYIDINDTDFQIKESLNEKFTEDSDPIADLNIGVIKEIKDFYNKENIHNIPYENWLALNLCIRLNKFEYIKFFIESEYIPQDVKLFGLRTAIFANKYRIVKMFIDAGYKVKDALYKDYIVHLRRFHNLNSKIQKLINDAFPPGNIYENINEKFIEDSDPIRDMGIGLEELKKFWRKEYEKEGNISSGLSSINYYGTEDYKDEAFLVYKFLKHICIANVQSQEDIQAVYNDMYKYIKESDASIEKIIKVLQEFYHIYIDPSIPVKYKLLDEKFIEDSDPITDLGIGMMHEIREYCKNKYLSSQDLPCSEIDEMLLICVDNQKYKYVKYLLDNGANPNTSAGIHSYDRGLPLRYAAFSNNLKLAKLLLKYGASAKLAFDEVTDLKNSHVLNRMSEKMKEFIIEDFYK